MTQKDEFDKYKLLILKNIEDIEKANNIIEKTITDTRLEIAVQYHNLEINIEKKLQAMSERILSLQIKVLLLCTGTSVFLASAISVFLKKYL